MSRNDRARLRRRSIGYVFQDFNLLAGLTAAENVSLPLELDGLRTRAARRVALEALEELGLADRADSYPDDLSGGERQRVAIARAVVGDRRLLLADEPTGALDSVNGEGVMRLVRAACKRGVAGVMVTHDAQLASWADRVVFLRDGRVVDQTAPTPGPESLLSPARAMSDTEHRGCAGAPRRDTVGMAPPAPRLAPAPADRAAPHCVGRGCRRFRLRDLQRRSGLGAQRISVTPTTGCVSTTPTAATRDPSKPKSTPPPNTSEPSTPSGFGRSSYPGRSSTSTTDRRSRTARSAHRCSNCDRVAIPRRTAKLRSPIGSPIHSTRRSARRSISTAYQRTVVGIVENPSDFDDEFVLLPPVSLRRLGLRPRALQR